MSYEIKLDVFEGPLDLLLYLIRKNEIDIYNIPIALITRQYLEYLDLMKALNLDLAGEYLVLAATLLHIKSRLLLPAPEQEDGGAEDETGDPRAELVQQLLEYQAFKEAALQLDRRTLLERDVFKRGAPPEAPPEESGEETPIEADIFTLVEAFQRMLAQLDQADLMEIDLERISLADRINEIMDCLALKRDMTFAELMDEQITRQRIVYTFLAVLELMKLRMIRVYQAATFAAIRIFIVGEE
ncbi:MAG TPA: segregation/condensation protein A [Syntrophales bacterium]|nr:segregation/condensation protein A [Syntrophales bacterium]